ncbi:regulatory subunit of ATP-dependent 26S proteasome [Hamiltosporidium magnivora]|uniref:Regulatory subunit of ATP-dependent 26S proteasome n=1 Tax=Hamiltosporidium magnivora TaxID=148818 RepID=A0A4Q9LL88_9MICR|nr:regulatory subunit of ATP-dependent 26S proteasome [Hamiltosporidium magnivora]
MADKDLLKKYDTLYALIKEHEAVSKILKEKRLLYKEVNEKYEKSEKDVKAMQSVGLIIAEIVQVLPKGEFIVKTPHGPRYLVGCSKVLREKNLKVGTRVALDITTLTIVKDLNREVDPAVFLMTLESPGLTGFEFIGGLREQIREIREVVELPIKNPEIFKRVGVTPPKGVLLYGPPGTGKTLLARAVAATLDVNFIKIVSSGIIEKYIGESSRVIREMFNYARERAPCIIFMDEIDAIGGKRSQDSTSSDREVQRTLMELLNQMDGFNNLSNVKIIMATNRPDILDPALLRPGRIDRKIEIPIPNEKGRREILEIHSCEIEKGEEIDFEIIVKLSVGFNGADLRNVCTEAGLFAIRDDRDYVVQDDFVKAVRKVADYKKMETKMEYKKAF